MIKDYFTKVADEIFWGEPEPEEINRYLRDCRFKFFENYSWGKALPGVDVLVVLTVDPQNYRAFTILDGKLVDLHQKHLEAECWACMKKREERIEEEGVTAQPF